jgi:hypothetical protein
MRLGVTSAAAPDAGIEELFEACLRRGLTAVELRCSDVLPDPRAASRIATAANVAGLTIAGVFADVAAPPERLAAISRVLHAPTVIGDAAGCAHDTPPSAVMRSRARVAAEVAACGGDALVLLSGPARSWDDVVDQWAGDVAWQVADDCEDPVATAEMLLRRRSGSLRYIRLVGGGPESVNQEGRGIGAVMKRLAHAGYGGPLILVPSSPRFRTAWALWLGRRGGWGCGGRAVATPLPLAIYATRDEAYP